ncbi:uncharacterized protein ACNS7B_009524 isoform 2-T3 [Menidia menidia]
MTFTVRRRRAVQLFLDRANDSSLSLFHLPPHCGYSIQTTWRDLSLMAQYDACHIIQENDNYVLPLLWRGAPVKMSCPVSRIRHQTVEPSSLCCSPHEMTFRVQQPSPTEEPRINVRGEWTPLGPLAEQCGYTLDKQDADTVLSVPFISCVVTVKNGKYTVSLQMGPKIFTLACPVSSIEELPINHQPLADSPHLIRRATKPMLGAFGPLHWIPPFYLAPPFYPHPTHHHSFAHPKGNDAHRPPTPQSLPPDVTFSFHSLPDASFQPNYLDHYFPKNPIEPYDRLEASIVAYTDGRHNEEGPVLDLSEKHRAETTSFPAEVEVPDFQPPSHDFSPYYHYYHHPKIPRPDIPQNLDPGPGGYGLKSSVFSHEDQFSSLTLNVQQSESSSKDASNKISPQKTTSYPYIVPSNPHFPDDVFAPNAPDTPYNYFYYFPQFVRGEAKRVGLLHPNLEEMSNLSYVQSHNSAVLEGHDQHGMNLHTNTANVDGTDGPLSRFRQKQDANRTRSAALEPAVLAPVLHRPSPVAVPPSEHPSLPTPGFIYNADPFKYYYNPYYNYYLMYYGPEGLLGAKNHAAPSNGVNPLLQPSSSGQHLSHLKHQTTTPPTKSMHDFQTGILHPYYYYYYYYYPYHLQLSNNNHLQQKPGSKISDKGTAQSKNPSNFASGRKQWFVPSSEARHPSTPPSLLNPFQSLYSHYSTRQQQLWGLGPYFEQYSRNGAKEKLNDKMRANPNIAPSCGLGADCRRPMGCCLYMMKDGAVGQYFVFAMPDSVEKPAVVPPALSSDDSNASCKLHRLAADLDVYIVPLDGCGVNKHMFGQTMVHLLEVQGMQANKEGSSAHGISPVRLMVGCSSSPDTPGEVRFHMMDQLPQPPIQPKPAPVTVLFRIATDGSFTSYYSEAHLPLSVLQSKPVYVELSLLGPSAPNLVLLVHSCLAYTLAPYVSWILFYDGCSSLEFSQLLPSPDTRHIRRIKITSFPSLPLESSIYTTHRGYSLTQDPEVYFLCLTETCSSVGDCSIGCLKGPNSDVRAMK